MRNFDNKYYNVLNVQVFSWDDVWTLINDLAQCDMAIILSLQFIGHILMIGAIDNSYKVALW